MHDKTLDFDSLCQHELEKLYQDILNMFKFVQYI
jgi:hypothetical protein